MRRAYQAAAERAVGLGATRLADGASWVTPADPTGHPFDICHPDGVGPAMQLDAVTSDAPEAVQLARFHAGLLGMEVAYDRPAGAPVSSAGRSVMFGQVGGYPPPRWPDPAHPQQAHLDILVDDLDGGRRRRGSSGPRGWAEVASGSRSSPTRPVTRSA